ncbi:MAG: glycosyltransferase family 9 protein [Candidatus Woesearchaeota archaeon]|jgi:heptosyltransferase-2
MAHKKLHPKYHLFIDLLTYLDRVLHPVFRRKIQRPKRIVLFRQDGIGDFIVSTPAFKTLRENYKDATIDIYVSPLMENIAKQTGYFDNVYTFNLRYTYKENISILSKLINFSRTIREKKYYSFIKSLRMGKYDLAIDLVSKRTNILAARLAGIKQIIGFDFPGGSFLLTQRYSKKHIHMSKNYLGIIDILGVKKKYYKSSLGEYNIKNIKTNERKGIAIHIGAGELVEKYWYGWNELLNQLSKHHKIILYGTNSDYEKKIYQTLNLKNKNIINKYGKLKLEEFIKDVNNINLLICHDSGPMHIADCLGIKVIGIFGPASDPVMWGPTNKGYAIHIADIDKFKNRQETIDIVRKIMEKVDEYGL